MTDSHRPKGWYSRGYLPHFDGGQRTQFITTRLFDSLPQNVLNGFRLEIERSGVENLDAELRRQIEKYLDKGYGSCFLRQEPIAKIVADALRFHDGEKYKLISWVIMPNHVHFMVRPAVGVDLSEIVHSIKSFTASESNKALNRRGQFWQVEPFDRYIRDSDHFDNAVNYIENNPVKAGLCKSRKDWQFSSAYEG